MCKQARSTGYREQGDKDMLIIQIWNLDDVDVWKKKHTYRVALCVTVPSKSTLEKLRDDQGINMILFDQENDIDYGLDQCSY